MLHAVRAAEAPIGVADLAERLSMHPNTVRFHLDGLERTRHIERTATPPAGRGRPPVRYRPAVGFHDGERRYDLLAGILASGLKGAADGHDRAREAGHAWGLARAKTDDAGRQDPVGRLIGVLGEVGFAPRRVGTDTVELLNCPFLDTVEVTGELVCGIHAGLMQGALAGWRAPVEVATLEPFVAPGICRASLVATGAG